MRHISCASIIFAACLCVVQLLSNDINSEEITITSLIEPRSQFSATFVPFGGDSGVVHFLLPNESSPLAVCYPQTPQEHLDAARMIHVICKQLHYVTFDVKYKEVYTRRAIMPTSAQCTGNEDDISQCPWKNVEIQKCQDALAIRCSSFNTKYFVLNGAVHSPGFPYTYLFSTVCEWFIEIPEDIGIELHFDKFFLPRTEKHECDAFVELTYGNQENPTNRRFCPADRVSTIVIPFKSVRIRFSSGIFRPKYEKQQIYFGLNIIFRGVPIEASNSGINRISLMTSVIIIFLILVMCIYGCYRYVKRGNNSATGRPIFPLQPNAPSEEELQAAFHSQRFAMNIQQNVKPNDVALSNSSSTDSCISRWRSHTDLPVTSALAPIGPESRKISIATTPRSVFPDPRRKWSEESAERIRKLRTKLVARFSSSSSHNMSDVSVFLPSAERKSYTKLRCEEDIPLESIGVERNRSSNETFYSTDIPDIVVEFVN